MDISRIKNTWTLACPLIDKPFAHTLWINNLKRLDFPKKYFKLVILDFSNNKNTELLYQDYIQKHGKEYRSVIYVNDVKKEYPSYVLDGQTRKIEPSFFIKRRSVAETMRIMSKYVEGNLLLWEDDIIVPPDAWNRLKKVFDWSDDIYAVTGVQYSRQLRMPGKLLAWNFVRTKTFGAIDSSEESTVGVENIGIEKARGVESVGATATGFVLYKDEFLKKHSFVNEGIFGQDIMAGIRVNELNKYWILCWDVKMPHLGIDQDGIFKIYKSRMCNTEVL